MVHPPNPTEGSDPRREAAVRGQQGTSLSRKVGRAALVVGARRVLIMAFSVVTGALLARLLGATDFGAFAAGFAAAALMGAVADIGFSLVLGRDLAPDDAARGALLRAATRVQTIWSILPALVLVGLALAAGLGDTWAQVMLVLTPTVLLSGLGGVRQVYMVMYRIRFVASIDVATNAAGSLLMVAIAAKTGSPVLTALAFTATTAANTAIVGLAGFRLVDGGRPAQGDLMKLFRRALPLGVASILSSVYFTIDLVLLGWLVSGPALGQYAAAVKFLSILVVLPGLFTAVALPGLSTTSRDQQAMSHLVSRVAHWLALVGLPACVGVLVFAGPLVELVYGAGYEPAVPLVRILALAGLVPVLGNILGILLVVLRRVREQLASGVVALAFNVVGNLILVPRYGVTASAWLTLATEIIVVAWAWLVLRPHVDLRPMLTRTWRSALATAVSAGAALLLLDVPLVAFAVAAPVYLAGILLLRAWPDEFRRGPAGGSVTADR